MRYLAITLLCWLLVGCGEEPYCKHSWLAGNSMPQGRGCTDE